MQIHGAWCLHDLRVGGPWQCGVPELVACGDILGCSFRMSR